MTTDFHPRVPAALVDEENDRMPGPTVSLTPDGDLYARDLIADFYVSLSEEEQDALPMPAQGPSAKTLLLVLMADGAVRLEKEDQGWYRREMMRIVRRWCSGEDRCPL